MDLKEARRLLEVDEHVTPTRLKAAYRDMMFVWHPDRFKAGSKVYKKAVSRTQRINEAYKALTASLDHPSSSTQSAQRPKRPKAKQSAGPDARARSQARRPPPGGGAGATSDQRPVLSERSNNVAREMRHHRPSKRASMRTAGVCWL